MSGLGGDAQDPARKQRRGQARARRQAAEEALAADAAKRKRLTQLGGVTAVLAVAIAVILLVTGGSTSEKPPVFGGATAEHDAALVESTLGGTTQHGATLGSAAAPVRMQYFGDLECPVCADFTLGALPSIIRKWVRSGRLKIEYRSLSTATGNAEREGSEPEGMFARQQVAALAAGEQNRAWNFIELFYHEQGEEKSGYANEAYLQALAKQIPGLDLARWTSDRAARGFQQQLAADGQEASIQAINSTPSFLIGKTGRPLKKFEYSSVTDPSAFDEAIETALKSQRLSGSPGGLS